MGKRAIVESTETTSVGQTGPTTSEPTTSEPAPEAAVPVPQPAAFWMMPTALVPWVKNDKIRINDPAIKAMVELVRSNGFTDPIVAWKDAPGHTYDDGMVQAPGHRITSGHLRCKAGLWLLRNEPEFCFADSPFPGMVPVRLVTFASEEQYETQAAAENFHLGRWNETGRDDLLRKLMGAGVELAGIGVEQDILTALLKGAKELPSVDKGPAKPPDAPPAPGQAGNTWDASKPNISYSITFDNEVQQQRWYEFLRGLKRQHADLGTMAGRLDEFLRSSADVAGLPKG